MINIDLGINGIKNVGNVYCSYFKVQEVALVMTMIDVSLQLNEGSLLITLMTRISICRRTQSRNLNASLVHTVPEFERLSGAHSPGI
jgi:hypothetical protein